ncbi:hypothetical protein J6253_05155 [bacterium]|nr:hypothetical protein [bacterium]MBP5592519.1 hypothetical protein [bacterium]
MTTNRIFSFSACLLFFTLVFPVTAFAEDAPEKGFKITKDTVLNVGIAINPEFESNITKASEDTETSETRTTTDENGKVATTTTTKNTEIVSDMILHYSPSLRIKLDDDKKTFGFSLLFDYNHYLGLEDKKTSKKLSELDIRSDLLGEFNKDGLIIFDFKNTLSRSSTPDGQELSGKNRNLLDSFAVGVAFKSVEDVLYGKIKLGFDINYLEQSKNNAAYKDYNYISPFLDLFGRWKFLPKTMAFASVAVRYQDYYESSIRDTSRAVPMNIFLGVMGQITPYLSSKLAAGYSVNIGDSVQHDYNMNAELVFKYQDTGLVVGYLKTLRPSAYFQYNSTHKAYLNFKQKFAKYFLASLNFNYSYIMYGKNIEFKDREEYTQAEDGSYQKTSDENENSDVVVTYSVLMPKGKRRDHLINFSPALSYAIFPWFGLKLSYNLEYKDTDYVRTSTTSYNYATATDKNYTKTTTTHYDYIDHRVMLSIVLDY